MGGQIIGCSRSGRDRSLREACITVVWPNCSLLPAEAAFGCAEAFENAPNPRSAIEMAAILRIKPSKTRRKKKADSGGEFFFIVEVVGVGGWAVATLRQELLKINLFRRDIASGSLRFGNGARRWPIISVVHWIDPAHWLFASFFFDDVRDESGCAGNHENAVECRGTHSQIGENGTDGTIYGDWERFLCVGKCLFNRARRLPVNAVNPG